MRRAAALGTAALIALAAAQAAAAPAPRGYPRPKPPPRPAGPFATAAMRAFLASRGGEVAAAVYDIADHALYAYHPSLLADDASIAKVDILSTLLFQAQSRGAALTAPQEAEAAAAIEQSDNDAAQLLWNDVGGNPAIAAFNAAVGMTDTVLDPQGVWGHYETTAVDQIRLLEHIALPNPVLDEASRAYELTLMRSVVAPQAWGVSGGVLAPARVALKNGWLPLAGGWEVNSIGQVSGRARDYLIAVLTSGDAGMTYGIQTIEGISALVWRYFSPRGMPAPSGAGI